MKAEETRTGWLQQVGARLRHWFFNVQDLLTFWLVTVLAQAIVPRTSYLADASLLPWLAVTLSGCLLLRDCSMLPAAHPALSQRRSMALGLVRRLTAASVPWVLLLWHEYLCARQSHEALLPFLFSMAGGASLILLVGVSFSQRERLTAWTPEQGGYPLLLLGAILLVTLPAWILQAPFWQETDTIVLYLRTLLPPALFTGSTFLLAGLLLTPPRDFQQFVVGQRHQGRTRLAILLRLLGPLLAAFLLPFPSMTLFHWLFLTQFSGLGFGGVMVHALFACLMYAALYPRPVPVAMACIFHEVRPSGSGEDDAEKIADFVKSPEGSLVFNPLNIERTRRLHPCLMPVESNQLALFESRAPHLWPLEGLPPQSFLLGHASFEVSGGKPQWTTVTIRKASRDVISWKSHLGYNLQRMLILRAFSPRWFRRNREAFEHEGRSWEGQTQSLGDVSDTMNLMNGDIVVLSIGGVIRAYEFEIGCPVYATDLVAHERPGILEDYVSLT